MAIDNLKRVWQLFQPSSRFEPVSRQVTQYIFHVYSRVQEVGYDVPIKVPLSIRAAINSARKSGCGLWPVVLQRVETTPNTARHHVGLYFDNLHDDSNKALELCAFFEQGLQRGLVSVVYDCLLELRRSLHRSVQEVCRIAKDDDVADLLSTYIEHLSRLKKLTPRSFTLQRDFCVVFGTLFERQRVSALFDKTLRKLQASRRPLCLWLFLHFHWDGDDDTLGRDLLDCLRSVLIGEGATWKDSTGLLATQVISAQVRQSYKCGSGYNFYFRDLHIWMQRYLHTELKTLLESMERRDLNFYRYQEQIWRKEESRAEAEFREYIHDKGDESYYL